MKINTTPMISLSSENSSSILFLALPFYYYGDFILIHASLIFFKYYPLKIFFKTSPLEN